MRYVLCVAAALATLVGCADEPCVEGLPADCSPEYPATFDQIHTRTLVPACAVAGGACHAADGKQGGLDLSEADVAYLALTSDEALSEPGPRVLPGDAACSLLVRRIESTTLDRVMPPGAPMREGVRCAIRQWVAEGATR